MRDHLPTVVTFESSAFNTTESRPHFINPGCFGDDLAGWLIERFKATGLPTDDEPEQEDFGWYLDFEVPEGKHCVVLSFRADDTPAGGSWVAWIERSRGFVRSLLGGRQRGISPTAISALHRALQHDSIEDLRWHEKSEFDAGREELGVPDPDRSRARG